ncbi:MAG TPA: CDP-archaeol synthase [Granulicella sp.]|nr:CDP-archaeol synthase [Granulicella sp.]
MLVNDVLGRRWSWPIDGGVRLVDGQPLLGSSKTIRGVLFSLLLTAVGAPLVGLGWKVGLLTGAFAMVGDLFSSFLKRRTRLPAGGRASGLDQMPESLFPLLACRHALGLSGRDIAVAVMAFFLGEVVLSLLFYKLRLRDRPY